MHTFRRSLICIAFAILPTIGLVACGHGAATTGSGTSSTTAGPALANAGIIRAGDGVQLGSGWYPLEHYKGLTFRWVKNDAEVLACPDANDRTLTMLVEPGPGVGNKPFMLSMYGNHGDHAAMLIRGRQYAKVSISPGIPAERFILHLNSPNLPTPHDPRILNFRAMDILLGSHAADCASDIVRDGSPIQIGKNWYPLESYAGKWFRWVNTGAQVRLMKAQPKAFALEAKVEPGPSLAGAPLVIDVQTADGSLVTHTTQIIGKQYIVIPLPASPAGTTYTLKVHSANKPVPGDPRILNFRVFDLHIPPST